MAFLVQAVRDIGETAKTATLETVGAAGAVTVGALAATGGLLVEGVQGDPLGGLQKGWEDGSKAGYAGAQGVTKVVGAGAGTAVHYGYGAATGVARGATALAINGYRVGEGFCRGNFIHADSPSKMARVCAYCSQDTYAMEEHGLTTETVIANGETFRVECVYSANQGSRQGDTHRWALYRVDSDKLVLAFRGTRLEKAVDILQDVLIILGAFNSGIRALEGLNLSDFQVRPVEALKTLYGAREFYVTGHSLGGSAAVVLASDPRYYKHIDEVHVYNPGTGFIQNDCNVTNVADIVRDHPFFRQAWTILRNVDDSDVLKEQKWVESAKIHAHLIFGDIVCAFHLSSDMIDTFVYDTIHGPEFGNRPHQLVHFTGQRCRGSARRGALNLNSINL